MRNAPGRTARSWAAALLVAAAALPAAASAQALARAMLRDHGARQVARLFLR